MMLVKPGLYDKLLDMESILVNLPHIKLSEFLFQK